MTTKEVRMLQRTRSLSLIMLAAGALLGYLAASGNFRLTWWANAAEQDTKAPAPQTTGVPGSPGATTTISGKQLPPPDPKFGGVIKENAAQSKAWWAPRVVPPKGAPNICSS
jgi:hypothetical protein